MKRQAKILKWKKLISLKRVGTLYQSKYASYYNVHALIDDN